MRILGHRWGLMVRQALADVSIPRKEPMLSTLRRNSLMRHVLAALLATGASALALWGLSRGGVLGAPGDAALPALVVAVLLPCAAASLALWWSGRGAPGAELEQIRERLAQACAELGRPVPGPVIVETVDAIDWVRATQSQFAPQRISDRLWIVQTWHEAPDASAINIRLDPGLAFGTGSHPTTRLCLQWLEQAVQGGESVLDYGCGSGILAIAAMKLGAGSALGIDIDAMALEAMESCDAEKLFEVVTRNNISMCGVLPAVIVMETLRALGGMRRCQRVGYATSADVNGDTQRVVGYAGALLR